MKTITINGRAYPACPKCSGKGYREGYEHVMNGVCFRCDGYKSAVRADEVRAAAEAKSRIRHIAELREMIARADLDDGASLAMRMNRKQMAAKARAQLEKMGVAYE